MTDEGLDAFVVNSPANVRYLTGFSGEGMLVVDDDVTLCSDSRYTVQAAEEAPWLTVAAGAGGHVGKAAARLAETGAARVGFEAEALMYVGFEALGKSAPDAELVSTRGVIERQRAVKDPDEIALVRRAAAIADAAFEELRGRIQPGMTERQVALDLDRLMIEGGARKPSFETIVASGPNGAKPHAVPGQRALAEGDLVVVDWGARAAGYCSDCTRTLMLGEPDARQRAVWQAVREAQLAGLEAVAPGVKWGVGLEVHEQPGLSEASEDTLAAGMVITVEPGVYAPDWGGVRLEESVLVTADGFEVLTAAPYDRV
jgi:Xaa-Pro aminopeptidase